MITYYLVRHGAKQAIPFDPPLTPVGIKQAEITAEHLKDISFKEIVASPKLRTKQTAEIIAKAHLQRITTDERLIERLEWEKDVSFEDFLAEWDKTDIDRAHQPKKGMSSQANGERMKLILEELADKHKDGDILIVTHGGTIGDVLRCLFTEEAIEHISDPASGAKYIDILECSITTIKKNGDAYALQKIGDVSHLSLPLI